MVPERILRVEAPISGLCVAALDNSTNRVNNILSKRAKDQIRAASTFEGVKWGYIHFNKLGNLTSFTIVNIFKLNADLNCHVLAEFFFIWNLKKRNAHS